MEEFKVLITTSGLGSRLGELTDYTNKALVRINDKPSLSHIIESYNQDIEFVITLGHFGSHVKQFLELTYPNHKFTFIEIDKFKGEGSSLGYSILKCKNELRCPFIFHASDTIIENYTFTEPTQNYIVCSNKEDNSQYRTINHQNNKLLKINEKGELNFNLLYVGIAGIKNYDMFFENLEFLVSSKYEDIGDVHCINRMVGKVNFNIIRIKPQDWFDVGNVSELYRTKKLLPKSIEVLDKKDESIFIYDDYVIKFFSNPEIVSNRVKRAEELMGIVPKILGSTDNFYKYEKVDGELFSNSVRYQSFKNFLYWSKTNLWKIKYDDKIFEKCYDFYIRKTEKRINDYLKTNKDVNVINGESIPDISELLKKIDINSLCNGIPCQFHGDFILDNVIQTKNGFCLIDWRQDFAGDLSIGDIYYDLSKLNHNLVVNHEAVTNNLFSYDSDNCFIYTNTILNECKLLLDSFIEENGYDLNKVNILTSIIWLNMSPLHDYPLNKFLFTFGKYNLYKTLKN
jgi:NDP-sugar pyrophosphorylase family protein